MKLNKDDTIIMESLTLTLFMSVVLFTLV